jgi:hypothetical protein
MTTTDAYISSPKKDPARIECPCCNKKLMAKFVDEGIVIQRTEHKTTHFAVVTLDMLQEWIKNRDN